MSNYTVHRCDVCKAEDRSDMPRAWDDRISPVLIHCPIDGINGRLEYDLCRSCRIAINVAINKAIEERGGV